MKHHYVLAGLALLFVQSATQAQMTEVPLNKVFKSATVLTFKPPYDSMKVFIEDDLDTRYSTVQVSEQTLYLKRPLGSRKLDKLKPEDKLTPADIRPGMKVDLRTDHYQRSLKNTGKEVVMAVDYYGTTSLKGLFEFLGGEQASVDGQSVTLNPGTVLRGLDEWKDKKFTSFNELQLGCELSLQGKREPDGIVYVTRGTARPIESDKEDRLLRRGVELALKVDKNQLTLAGTSFQRTFITNPTLQDYVNSIGRKIVPEYLRTLPVTHPDHIDFKYYLVEDETLNASAFPNGAVVIHTGMLKKIDNEAQLAAVIGHELAHVTQKHQAKNYRKRQNWDAVSSILGTAALVTMGNAGVVPALVVGMTSEMYVSKYSRAHETQADRIGLRYMYDAGYDVREAANIWKKLAQDEADAETNVVATKATNVMLQMMGEETGAIPEEVPTPEKRESLYASHPLSRDRFNHVNFLLSTTYANVDLSKAIVNNEQHRKMILLLKGKTDAPATSGKTPAKSQKVRTASTKPKPKKP